jgi:hypothetical protein
VLLHGFFKHNTDQNLVCGKAPGQIATGANEDGIKFVFAPLRHATERQSFPIH